MTITYAVRVIFSSLLLASQAVAQSLEDKVSQARKMQAESQLGLDEQAIESILREKKAQKQEKIGETGHKDSLDLYIPDSMVAGPGQFDQKERAAGDSAESSAAVVDSLARAKTDQSAKPLPKRYEQRIFATVDRSAFSSARGSVGRDYILAPGDEFRVSLWGDKEKEYDLALNGEGKIFLEGVGLLSLSGMSLDEAQKSVKEKLSKIYSGIGRGTTQVELSLVRAGPIKVFVLGEVRVPGGYVFTGNTSVLSALYFARGPTDIGTVRTLQLTRNGKKLSLDVYKYLINGESLNPDQLRDGDILFSARAECLVEISGDVGRPATYELKNGEGVKELLRFAGGLNSSAAQHRLTLQRIFPGGRIDYVDLASPQEYLSGAAVEKLQDGDKIVVKKSTELSQNFLNIAGPVNYPGTYAFKPGLTIYDLVKKAGGLRDDAFLGRIHVVRLSPDGSSKLFAYSLDTTAIEDILLEPKDNVLLYSTKEMYLPDSVEIVGAVFNPGKYEYRTGMNAKDLVMQAGGFLPEHEGGKLLIFRGEPHERKVEQITISTDPGLGKGSDNFTLRPRDLIHVPIDPRWYKKEVVTLEGLFRRPGKYALLYPGEKLVSVIQRANGFKENAYVEGGRFFRAKDKVGRIGVNIQRALHQPSDKFNIALVGDDSIFIPEKLNTVKVMGEVGFETSVLFQEGKTVKYYIEKAGGFTRRSEKNRIVVQYANGETSRDGYFNRKPDAGSFIYVPTGPEPQAINWVSSVNILLGTLTAAVTLLLLTSQFSKN
ncbi:MAG TPA: SLBB domain-containing protein [Fibrobacteria bacterium]|nr:SLBB domain-containing protein [Fibrobacteria bacterium]